MSYFTTSDNMRIYFEDTREGSEGTLVLMHGGFLNAASWAPAVAYYSAKGYRVVTFDARGHGNSSKPETGLTLERWATDVEELLEYLDLHDIVLLGYSFSVHVLFNYIEMFGCGRLKKVVTVDMSPKWIADETWPYGIYKGTYDYHAHLDWVHLLEKDPYAAYDYFNRQCALAEPMLEPIIGEFTNAAMTVSVHVARMVMMELARRDYRDMLSQITVPTLIVYGEPGSLYQTGDAEEMAKRIPNAKLAPVQGGHTFYMVGPQQLHDALDAFLAE